jgi:four helix bundle protein
VCDIKKLFLKVFKEEFMIPLEELKVYQVAMEIGDAVWEIVDRWAWFAKQTLGRQFTESADSMAFNIAEGYGRFHYKENKNFCYYSRGSAKETSSAICKARKRNLITEEEKKLLESKLYTYFILLNPTLNLLAQKKLTFKPSDLFKTRN